VTGARALDLREFPSHAIDDESPGWSRAAFGSPPGILAAANLNERLPSAII
jgi:hypothetical protein